MPLPRKITAASALLLAQSYTKQRTERLALQKALDALEEKEKATKQDLLDMLEALKLTSIGDSVNTYTLVTKQEPTVEDWPALYGHIKRTGEFELLYRRVNPAAVKERWEDNKAVPGVVKFPAISLSVTKTKGT